MSNDKFCECEAPKQRAVINQFYKWYIWCVNCKKEIKVPFKLNK